MKIYRKRSASWRGSQWIMALFAAVLGCSPTGRPLASGQVQLSDGIGFTFAGDTLELRAKDKPTQVAFGQLGASGDFKIESLVDGKLVAGAPAGTYQARVVIADDDYQHKAAAHKAIPKKYFSFETSNLTVEVPSDNIQLKISK